MTAQQQQPGDSARRFSDPQEILENVSLTDERKLEILEGWRADLIELQVAEQENMPSPGPDTGASAKKLSEVTRAIAAIRGEDGE
jgi:hypothetical protein